MCAVPPSHTQAIPTDFTAQAAAQGRGGSGSGLNVVTSTPASVSNPITITGGSGVLSGGLGGGLG